MSESELKQRRRTVPVPAPGLGGAGKEQGDVGTEYHPAGGVKHGGHMQLLRLALFATYFWAGCFT